MNVLLIGSGGREHALAWKLAASPLLEKLYAAPGNPGVARHAECVALDTRDHEAVVDFCRDRGVDFVVVGPEAPLVAGIADDLIAADIPVFGPTADAARLEGSKGFTKDLCARYGIPTAAYARFADARHAKDYVRNAGMPIVVKADGLAAGKGVTIATSEEEAFAAIEACFSVQFEEGAEIVIEEFRGGGGTLLLPLRRKDGASLRHGSGSQARRRRRYRSQYGRHGGLFTRTGHDR